LLLTACVLAVALLLVPVAIQQDGTGGSLGLLVAALICWLSGLVADASALYLSRAVSPLAGMMSAMAVRMILPLTVCVALAAMGQGGRQHLAFIGYLVAFYIATLALETWLAVKRVAGPSPTSLPKNAR
jgi:hypothetical protein